MEKRSKINLQKHTSPKASRGYLLRLLIYIIILAVAIYFLVIAEREEKKVINIDPTEEIHDVQIESE